MGPVVAVVEPQAVPVDRCLQIALVLDVDDDLRAFLDFENRSRDRLVVGEHPHRCPRELLHDWGDPELELVSGEGLLVPARVKITLK